MIEQLKKEYKKYLNFETDFQKKVGKLNLNKLNIISGVTCIGKNFFINYYNLPTLYSYKTGLNIKIRNKQKKIEPKKFYNYLKKGYFFDFYNLGDKFYSYKIEDYFIRIKEFGEVFVDVSIEALYNGLKYDVGKIYILDYTDKQLEENIKKRIKERNYSEDEILNLYSLIEKEKEMLRKIKNEKKYKNIVFLKNIDDFK